MDKAERQATKDPDPAAIRRQAVAYLKTLFDAGLFVRVCMVTWGVPFVGLGLFAVFNINPVDVSDWLILALVSLLGVYGMYLVYVGFLGSELLVERSIGFMADGGDFLGLLFALVVAIVAVPVTLLVGFAAKRKKG